MTDIMPIMTHRLSDRSIPRDLSVLHEHVGSRDSDICELRVSYDQPGSIKHTWM
jgi:hypothetical protein